MARATEGRPSVAFVNLRDIKAQKYIFLFEEYRPIKFVLIGEGL